MPTEQEIIEIGDECMLGQQEALAALAALYLAGSISAFEWEQQIQQTVQDEYIRQYALGKNERPTADEIALLSGLLVGQYAFLQGMTNELDLMSERQIAARSQLYMNSSRQALERGRAARLIQCIDTGIANSLIPAFPGDGSTRCRSNCKCWLEHVFNDSGCWIGVNWVLRRESQHCSNCPARAVAWNPLILVRYNEQGLPVVL